MLNENFRLMTSEEEKVPLKGEDISPDHDGGKYFLSFLVDWFLFSIVRSNKRNNSSRYQRW